MSAKSFFSFLLEVFQIVAIAVLVVFPIRYFVFQPFIVKGASMEPNFHNGDYLIIDELTYRFREPERGEVVVFRFPQDPSQRFIKRIVGLPGETVEVKDGRLIVTDKFGNSKILDEFRYLSSLESRMDFENLRMNLGQTEYFVLGDNRLHSFDSRKWGVLERKLIVGRVVLRAWPPQDITGFLSAPAYNY